MSAFPKPDPRYAEVLAARQVPREHWRNDHKWVRFYRPVCQKYRHHPADAKSLPLCLAKLAAKHQPSAQRAQAQGAVEDYAVCLSPQARTLPHDAVPTTAPHDRAVGIAARTSESLIGASHVMAAQAPFLTQAHGTSAQTDAAWREVDAQLQDEIMRRHYSRKTLQAYAGWMRKCRSVMVNTHPSE